MIRAQMAGTQRSGSNLLRLLLDAHDDIAGPPSVHMFRVLREVAAGYGPLDRAENRQAIIGDLRELIRLNVFAWRGGPPSAGAIAHRWEDESVAGLCHAAYDAFADREGAGAWVCKSLENVHHLPELRSAAPGLIVVHLVRDGRDVALSFQDLPVGPKHPYVVARAWIADQRAAMAAARSPGPFLRVRYEALTAAPAEVVAKVCDEFGVAFDERALAFHTSAEAQAAPGRSPLWQNLDQPVLATNTGKFADPAHRTFVEIFEQVAFDVLVELGYSPLYAEARRDFATVEVERFVARDRALRSQARRRANPVTERLHQSQGEFVLRLRARRG